MKGCSGLQWLQYEVKMLKETYRGKYGLTAMYEQDKDAKFYVVMRRPQYIKFNDRVVRCPVLSPSIPLLQGYQNGSITWDEYVPRFLSEMQSLEAQAKLKEIVQESKERDVYLVCSCGKGKNCHRFLLMDIAKSFLKNFLGDFGSTS